MAEKVTNGTLESWTSATDLDNFTETIGGSSTVNRESTAAHVHGGTYSCKLDIDSNNTHARIEIVNLTLVASTAYRLSFWYKNSEASKRMRVWINDAGDNKGLESTSVWSDINGYAGFQPANATSYTQYVIPFITHASYTNYDFQFGSATTGEKAASSQIWVDDISITEEADGLVDAVTGSIALSDSSGASRQTVYDSVSVKDNFKIYLASAEGRIFTFDKAYLSDDGATIVSRWRSKTLDFADQIPECHDAFKTVNNVKLFYKDLTTTTPVTVFVSTDSGQTWEWVSKNLGTGTDAILSADFEFLKTGEFFVFAIEHSSTNKEFMWLKAEIDVTPGGPHFVV